MNKKEERFADSLFKSMRDEFSIQTWKYIWNKIFKLELDQICLSRIWDASGNLVIKITSMIYHETKVIIWFFPYNSESESHIIKIKTTQTACR